MGRFADVPKLTCALDQGVVLINQLINPPPCLDEHNSYEGVLRQMSLRRLFIYQIVLVEKRKIFYIHSFQGCAFIYDCTLLDWKIITSTQLPYSSRRIYEYLC